MATNLTPAQLPALIVRPIVHRTAQARRRPSRGAAWGARRIPLASLPRIFLLLAAVAGLLPGAGCETPPGGEAGEPREIEPDPAFLPTDPQMDDPLPSEGFAWPAPRASSDGGAPPPVPRDAALASAANSDTDASYAAALMTGSFSSAAQAARDPDYRVLLLHGRPIWGDRTDGFWLYIEQAVAATADRPYRQRIYQVHGEPDGTVHADVYELPGDPLRFAGAWRNPDKLAGVERSDLSYRDGCTIVLVRQGDAMVGGTQGTNCPSSLRGASYATSEVTLTDGRILLWDRGFDRDGNQVWGPKAGGYEFLRIGGT